MAERIEIILNTRARGEDYREELRMQGRKYIKQYVANYKKKKKNQGRLASM